MTDSRPALSAPLVVIVDDDAAVRAALAFTVELDGYSVVTCPDAAALLALDLPAKRGCLILDERLPDISGLAALAQLRLAGCRLPAVLITSHPNRRLRQAAQRAGAPILEKPLMEDGLIAWVRAAAPQELDNRPPS